MKPIAAPELACAALAAAAGAAAVAFGWQPGLASLHDDSVSYLVMAQAFSPFQAAAAPVLEAMPREKYPPGFPLLLAWSGGAFDWRIAHAVVGASFAVSLLAFAALARRMTGSAALALIATATYAALPGAWLNMKGILSEFPYMALAFATLAWHHARREEPLSLRAAAVLGGLLAAALLTRTIGIALALAIACSEGAHWWKTRDQVRAARVLAALAITLAATAAWYVLRPGGGEDAYVTSSASVAERAAREGPVWIATLLRVNASAIMDAWLNALMIYWGEATQPKFLLGCALGIAGLAGTFQRARRGEADAIYCVFFVAILLAWPYPGQMYRLLLPIVPLVLLQAWPPLTAFLSKRFAPPAADRLAAAAALLPLAFCVPALFYIADRAHLPGDREQARQKNEIMDFYRIPHRPAAEEAAARQVAVLDDMDRIRAATPPEARVMWYGPAYIALLAGRRGVPLDVPADAADMAAQVRRLRPDYLYLSHLHPRDSAHRLGDPLAPAAYVGAYADPVWIRRGTANAVEAVLFRVAPERAGAP